MIAKLYQYSLPKENVEEWNDITSEANEIYQGYGMLKAERLLKETENSYEVIELGYYESLESYESVVAQADADPRVQELYEQFTTVVDSDISEDEYVVLEQS